MKWLQLKDSVTVWADAVERAVEKGRADIADVVTAIEMGGFDSRVFARKICELYEESMNR